MLEFLQNYKKNECGKINFPIPNSMKFRKK